MHFLESIWFFFSASRPRCSRKIVRILAALFKFYDLFLSICHFRLLMFLKGFSHRQIRIAKFILVPMLIFLLICLLLYPKIVPCQNEQKVAQKHSSFWITKKIRPNWKRFASSISFGDTVTVAHRGQFPRTARIVCKNGKWVADWGIGAFKFEEKLRKDSAGLAN